jgi:hypothetical protein
MTLESETRRGQTTCLIDVSPAVVEAGTTITLQGRLSCTPACDLRGHDVVIRDHAGADAGCLEVTEFDGQANRTNELLVKPPLEAGEYTWSAVCPVVTKDGVVYEAVSVPILFTVKPHTTNVIAWDIPSAIESGSRFRIKVGVKCSSGCRLANSDFGIYDQQGERLAVGTVQADVWPGTTGLYVGEAELAAPAQHGLHTWRVVAPYSDVGMPHAKGSIRFGVSVVEPPEHLVTVDAVDRATQSPLIGARVVMHPYRVVTDEFGRAEVRVAKGAYKLFVSQTRYVTFGLSLEVDADETVRVQLDFEPVSEPY